MSSLIGGGGMSNHFGSPHSDVLSVIVNDTTTSEQRETLYTELQRRSKAAVQAKQWHDSITLYTKAIECCSTGSSNDSKKDATATESTTTRESQQYQHMLPLTKATLHANISLCLGKMNRWTEAVTAAQQSVEIDPSYMKGWYRLGQACGAERQYSDAVHAFQRAQSLDLDNIVLQKELEKYTHLLQEQMNDTDARNEGNDVPTSTTTTTTSAKHVVQNHIDDVEIKVMDGNNNSNHDDDEIIDESTNSTVFTKSDHVRGYKIVNGKKTSYFHNELTEDAKKLIGDIAPKKLNPNNDNNTNNENATKVSSELEGKSVWNKAGTWEEKDCTGWASDTITELFSKVSWPLPISSPAPNAVLSVSKIVISSNSHASFATVRGKKRYIYEFDITVHWNFNHNELEASGTIRFPDIDGTCVVGDGYDVTDFVIVHMDDNTLQPVLTQFVQLQGLRTRIHETIDEWVRLFKDTY